MGPVGVTDGDHEHGHTSADGTWYISSCSGGDYMNFQLRFNKKSYLKMTTLTYDSKLNTRMMDCVQYI